MNDFSMSGADDFLRLSKALKAAGRTDTRKALHRGLRDVVNRSKPDVAKTLGDALPSGLAAKGTRVKQAVQVKTGVNPGVTVAVRYGKAGTGIGAANAQRINQTGTFRHPVHGSNRWVNQSVPGGKGWFDKAWMNKAPLIRAELMLVLEQVADDIVKKAR